MCFLLSRNTENGKYEHPYKRECYDVDASSDDMCVCMYVCVYIAKIMWFYEATSITTKHYICTYLQFLQLFFVHRKQFFVCDLNRSMS